ncbi:hypothetical protein ScPMuIL_004695 [Solemya velum]
MKNRSKSSQEWLRRQVKDPYVKRAHEEHWRCRSAYKLIEMDDKLRLLSPGMTVVDCGAAPGSWSQVAVDRTNSSCRDKNKPVGKVISVDLHGISPIEGSCIFSQSDFTSAETQSKILSCLGKGKANVVLSDMAPNATGVKHLDHDLISELCLSVLTFSTSVLSDGGAVVCKIWMGHNQNRLLSAMKTIFKNVKIMKPNASRGDSSEIFLVGRGYSSELKR